MTDTDTLIVGAGLAGVSAAREAQQFGDVRVVEARSHVGGVIRSERSEGYLCESAAASVLLPASATSTLIATCSAAEQVIPAFEAAKQRWILTSEGLIEVPMSPQGLLVSRIVSPWAKLGALVELVTPTRNSNEDESVESFIARRFGAEIAGRVAQPMIGGVFAGNASRISVEAAFPRLVEMERDGGVLRSGISRMRLARSAKAPRAKLHSFRDGMQSFIEAAATALGDGVLSLDCQITRIEKSGSTWLAKTSQGTISARRLVLTCEPEVAASLLETVDPALVDLLNSAPRAPVAVVHIGCDIAALDGHNGFGFLVHPDSGRQILGAVFDSAVFEGRAPAGRALIRVLIGGALASHLVKRSNAELIALAAGELSAILAKPVDPLFAKVARQPIGIPQYEIGHLERVRAIDRRLSKIGGCAVTGWAYRGVGVNGVTADATASVRALCGAVAT